MYSIYILCVAGALQTAIMMTKIMMTSKVFKSGIHMVYIDKLMLPQFLTL